jgi:NADP-dependent aldehyde dehydrogenase
MTTTASRVEAAQSAFEAARTETPDVRAGWLDRIADALDGNKDELIALAAEETHLTTGRLTGELARTVFQLRLLADEIRAGAYLEAIIDHADPGWGMGPRPDIRRINEPLGVVGVFGASNFPFAFSVMGGDSASALAAGCAVVHKAHPGHPRLARRTAELAIEALDDAGAPHGLFSLIEGEGSDGIRVGEQLVDHPLVKAVGFTGSTRGGRALFDRAAARDEPIPFYGELGSTNPVFVTQAAWAARRDDILSGFVGSVSLGMGQFCTKPGFIAVPSGAGDELRAALETAASAVAGHPMLTQHLRDSFEDSLDELADLPDFEVIVDGETDDEVPLVTILRTNAATIEAAPDVLEHEMFGPASVVIEYDAPAELVKLAELAKGQLTTTIHAEDDEDQSELVATLRARSGRVLWNGWPTGVTVSFAQEHGGPYPATTAPSTTSVGTAAIGRFLRPVAYQGFPQGQLPPGLQDSNPWGVPQRVDGERFGVTA